MILNGEFDEYSHFEPNFVHISVTISCFFFNCNRYWTKCHQNRVSDSRETLTRENTISANLVNSTAIDIP